MGMADSTLTTVKHRLRVQELLSEAASEILRRGRVHDLSKHKPAEKEPLDEMQRLIETEGQAPFGSEEYERRKTLLGSMLAHHYANNSHHPEHYENGVTGMDLFDLIEMFFDWKAASERGEEASMNINAACEKYAVADQLRAILENTADRLGYRRA